jgi:Leucine-rich repeat (LRR) protein
MNCDPNSLMAAARCFSYLPKGDLLEMQIHLLCQWHNHLTPPGPEKPVNPGPGDAAANVTQCGTPANPFILSWADGGGGTTGYDVWFNGAQVAFNQPGTTLDITALCPLTFGLTYTWRVDAIGPTGTTTGDDWTFTVTAAFAWDPPGTAIYWEDSGGAHTDTLVNFNIIADHCTVTWVNASSLDLNWMVGLASLPRLVRLDVDSSYLVALDVTGNRELKILNVGLSSLTALDVSNCVLLEQFSCGSNPITSLDLTGLTQLQIAECNICNLTTLNLDGCSSLIALYCSGNAGLTDIDNLDSCVALTTLTADSCAFTAAPTGIGACTLLSIVRLYNNFITGFNEPTLTALTQLYIQGNSLTTLVVDYATGLTILDCNTNLGLTALDLTGMAALAQLDCSTCDITGTLDLSDCSSLTNCTCAANTNLTGITMPVAGILDSLTCSLCGITGTLDASPNTSLITLQCNNNPNLTGLDMTGLGAMLYLYAHECDITGTLDLSDCTALTEMTCFTNSLLTDLRIGPSIAFIAVIANGCALPASPGGAAEGVDDILVILESNCIGNIGNCDLTGGTNAAPDAGPPDGATAKANLNASGNWTVVTN